MLIHLLLLVALLLLPGSNQRSLNADHLQRKNETTQEGAKSLPLLKEVHNFVDGECPPSANVLNVNGVDGKCQNECSSDIDCTEDYRCCQDGCSFKCMEPWFPNRVVDWAKSSSLNQISDGSESPDQRNGPWKSRGEPCSTSVLDGLQPLRCPTNYACQIIMDGDIQLHIPNRGECMKINDKKPESGIMENANHPDFSIIDTVCSHKGETYKHKEKFRKDCNICVCHNGVVFCDNQPCPLQIGIPAAISNYEEQTQTSRSQFISIDSDEGDTEDESRSSGSGEGGEAREETQKDNTELTNLENVEEFSNDDDEREGDVESKDDEEEKQSEDRSGDGESVPRLEVNSGDGDEAYWSKVNSGDNDDGSGDDDQTQQREVNNGKNSTTKVIDFSGKSGPVELETEAPERAEPTTTTTTIGEPGITSTLTQKTSTLSLKLSTLTREFPTVTSKTLATEISTLSAGVEHNETTTKSSRLQKIKPTEDIIRLEESDYESSGISWENYSGDDKEGSSGNSGEYGSSDLEERSTEETQSPEPVSPDTIVLEKYIRGVNQDAEFGFETDDSRTDVVNDRSLNQETEAGSGDEESASGSIVGNNDARKHKQRSKTLTLEYLATTDDEN
ncbi:WAP four-disulfide core domain 1 isoform X1 [Paramuricea clavata]|uniref:WAP four-disulfide core domain 1 isoform X1 n=1 Tax=Paramuricea clavata TaxID=317549 RepID=A0A7D9HAC9_PARCT|nr:WAP four-disulfide core domain 1 isoform X1 [Paramuricea clavata]